MGKKATIKDVANLAGCSKATVSFVLNGKPGISESTRKKVINACNTLGYGTIELPLTMPLAKICLIDVVRDSFISEPNLFEFKRFYVRGIQKRCDELNIEIESVTLYELSVGQVKGSVQKLSDVSGFIVLGSDLQTEKEFEIFSWIDKPTVFIDTFYASQKYNFINIDNRSGMMLMANHLRELGHREVGLISINTINYNIREREEVFEEVARWARFATRDEWIFRFNIDNENDLAAYVEELYRDGNMPSAIICTTDLIPIQLFPAFAAVGVEVPRDVSVVGYGDLHLSTIIRPQLTSINPPKNQIGRAAVELIANRLQEANQMEALGYNLNPERVLVSNNIIVRESASPPKRAKQHEQLHISGA